jgi:hypothetical protein
MHLLAVFIIPSFSWGWIERIMKPSTCRLGNNKNGARKRKYTPTKNIILFYLDFNFLTSSSSPEAWIFRKGGYPPEGAAYPPPERERRVSYGRVGHEERRGR